MPRALYAHPRSVLAGEDEFGVGRDGRASRTGTTRAGSIALEHNEGRFPFA